MNVSIDRSGCIGCGFCVGTCPEIFAMGEDGASEVKAQPTAANLACAKQAAEGCPVSVITVTE